MLAIFNGTFRYRALMFPAKTAFVAASALLLVGCLGRQKVEEPDLPSWVSGVRQRMGQ